MLDNNLDNNHIYSQKCFVPYHFLKWIKDFNLYYYRNVIYKNNISKDFLDNNLQKSAPKSNLFKSYKTSDMRTNIWAKHTRITPFFLGRSLKKRKNYWDVFYLFTKFWYQVWGDETTQSVNSFVSFFILDTMLENQTGC